MRLYISSLFLVAGLQALGQNCCDQDAQGFYEGPGICNGEQFDWNVDGTVCDTDCDNYDGVCVEGSQCYDPNDPACTIPLDGGLSLLALAGGGLATAAMRRRREEEVRQADKS